MDFKNLGKKKGESEMQLNTKLTKNKKQSGITLIALVVTIVVLLILAGVSVNALFGNSGIIEKAKEAQDKMNKATENDQKEISELTNWIDNQVNGTTGEDNQNDGIFVKNITTMSDILEEGKSLQITNNMLYDNYTNLTVGDAIKKFNEGQISTVKELCKELGVNISDSITTTKGNELDIEKLNVLTAFRDTYITDGKTREYSNEVPVKIKYEDSQVKNLTIEASNIIVLSIAPSTAKVSFYEIESYEKTTGELTFEIDSLGPIIILNKG